jgi:surfactin synthase thioesterase subunit
MTEPGSPDGGGDWIVRPRLRAVAHARLLCLPHAGSGPSAYVSWHRHLPPEVELAVVSPPGRELRYREAHVRDPEVYLGRVQEALGRLPPLPLVIFGHSMGAVLGYELGARLARTGNPARALFVSARAFPDDLPAAQPLHRLPDEDLIREIRARYDGFPRELDEYPDLFEQALGTLRADLQVLETLHPRFDPKLEVPLWVLWSPDDRSYDRAGIGRWRAAAREPVQFRDFPGGHFYLWEQPREVVGYVWDSARAVLENS